MPVRPYPHGLTVSCSTYFPLGVPDVTSRLRILQSLERGDRAFEFANRTEIALTQVHCDIAEEAFNDAHPRVGVRSDVHVEALW